MIKWTDIRPMRVFTPSELPPTIAGRLEFLSELLAGPVIVDENGEPTGERGPPMITRELYLKLLGQGE